MNSTNSGRIWEIVFWTLVIVAVVFAVFNCIVTNRREGYEKGYEEGYDEGYRKGYEDRYENSYGEWFDEGYCEGYSDAEEDFRSTGKFND